MSGAATLQIQPLSPVPAGVQIVMHDGLVSHTWNKWFVDLAFKVNTINATLAAWAGITPVTGLAAGTYGDTTHYPIVTVNQHGMITAITEQTVSDGGGNPIYVTNVTSSVTVALSNVPNTSANKGLIVVNSGSNTTVSIDTFANTSIPVGTDLIVFQQNTGSTSFVGLTGVTFQGPTISGGGQGASGRIIQIATDIWMASGNIAYASGGDPYWTYVVSLLHFIGSNGSTTFTDEISSNSWNVSNAIISTAKAKFGTSSGYFNGSAYIDLTASATFGFGTSPYTVECFLYVVSASNAPFFDNRTSANYGVGLYSNSPSFPQISSYSDILATGTNTFPIGVWTHIAFCRNVSNVTTCFVGGVSQFTVTDSRNLGGACPIYLGANILASQFCNCYMAEMRVTAGICRYTANFTPPTAPFPNN